MKNGKLHVVYLSDDESRINEAYRKIQGDNHVLKMTRNYIETKEVIYEFYNANSVPRSIKPDQIIIHHKESIKEIAEAMLIYSCVPKNYQILDDIILDIKDRSL